MTDTRPELEVLFVDMDAFFASVEQMDHPPLRARPVGVTPTPGPTGCCIATSYEARARGVKTGCRVGEAERLCPGIVIRRSRPDRYIEIHHAILGAIGRCVPVTRVESVDECWALLMENERPRERAETIALAIKEQIRQDIGPLSCSVGVGPNRLIAKIAAGMNKPDGLTVIERSRLPGALLRLELTDIPGIARGISARLAAHGITGVQDLYARSLSELRSAWGSVLGEYWYHWIRGERIDTPATRTRSVGHQHVLAPKFRDPERARAVGVRLVAKAAQRMRSMDRRTRRLSLGVRFADGQHWGAWTPIDATSDTIALTHAYFALWDRCPKGRVFAVSVTLEGLEREGVQLLLPYPSTPIPSSHARSDLMHAIDVANRKHGHDAVYLGSMHHARDSAPRRIPFAWIPDLALPDIEERDTD